MVDARAGKRLGILSRLAYHQMSIENQPADLAQLGNYRRTDRDVRDKVAVHDIQMDDVHPSVGDFGNLLG